MPTILGLWEAVEYQISSMEQQHSTATSRVHADIRDRLENDYNGTHQNTVKFESTSRLGP